MKKILIMAFVMALAAPVMAQRGPAGNVRKEVEAPKSTKMKSDKNSRPSNDVPVSGEQSKNSAYKNLTAQKAMILHQIDALSAELQQSKGGISKKISKQLEMLANQLTITDRLLATFPQATNREQVWVDEDRELRRQLDSTIAVRIAATDPFAGQLSKDPELDRLYREYVSDNRNAPMTGLDNDYSGTTRQAAYGDQDKIFRILVAISRNAIPSTSFGSLTDIVEQKMPGGGYVYYQGQYTSAGEADRACRAILAQRRFRDAFVVAMVGNKRVPL